MRIVQTAKQSDDIEAFHMWIEPGDLLDDCQQIV